MSILQIIQYPDLRLRRKSRDVAAADVKSKKIKKIINDMIETLANTKNCAALAATQLNIEQPPSIIVINSLDGDDGVLCLINPQITAQEGSNTAKEGCMSISSGDAHSEVKRATRIKVKALDAHGKQIKLEITDDEECYLARCIQHEYDHLNGVLYIDHLSKLNKT